MLNGQRKLFQPRPYIGQATDPPLPEGDACVAPYGFGGCGGVFVFRLLRSQKDVRDPPLLRLLPSQKDVQDNVAALGALCVGARCVFVEKKFQPERMCFPEKPVWVGVTAVDMADMVVCGRYSFWN